jgi:hypothetical protein
MDEFKKWQIRLIVRGLKHLDMELEMKLALDPSADDGDYDEREAVKALIARFERELGEVVYLG